jgi:hypothetical protein
MFSCIKKSISLKYCILLCKQKYVLNGGNMNLPVGQSHQDGQGDEVNDVGDSYCVEVSILKSADN